MSPFSGNAIDKCPEDTGPPSRKHSSQAMANGVANKSSNELLYSHTDTSKNMTSEKPSRNSVKVPNSSLKKLGEDHNLNELESKNEHDGRLANGHGVRSFTGSKRSSPLQNNVNGEHFDEDSDSGDSSNTSTSSGTGGNKKESPNKPTQVCNFISGG